MEITATDVMPKVILRESLSGTGGTPKEQAARVVGQKLVSKSTPEEWRQAQEELAKKKTVEQIKIDKKAEEIGVGRDATSGQKSRTPEEEARYKGFKDAAAFNKRLVEAGYDRMNAAEQLNLRNVVEGRIRADPRLLAQFNSLSRGQQISEIEKRLRDPKLTAKLSEIVNERLDRGTTLLDTEEAKIAEEATMENLEDAKTERASINRKVALTASQLKSFESTVTPGSSVSKDGPQLMRMKDAEGKIQSAQTDLANARPALANQEIKTKSLKDELDKLQKSTLLSTATRNAATVQAELTTAQSQEKIFKEDVVRLEQELSAQEALHNGLQEQRDTLIEQQRLNDLEVRRLDRKVNAAEKEHQRKLYRLTDATNVRVGQEEDVVEGMRRVFDEAMDKSLEQDWDAMKTKVDTELEETRKNTANADERAILTAEGKRWEKKKTTWTGKERITISREQTEKDFLELLTAGNPDKIMGEMLKTQVNTRTMVGYNDSDIKALLADKADGSFYKKMAPEVIAEVLKRKILAGGITKADVFNIQSSQWGEGMIQAALDKNKKATAEMEKLLGEKAINKGGFATRLWEETKKHPWYLAFLFGLIALPVMAAKEGTAPTSSMVS